MSKKIDFAAFAANIRRKHPNCTAFTVQTLDNDGQIVIRVYDDQEEIVGQHGYSDEPSDATLQADAIAVVNALHFSVTAKLAD